MKSWNMRSMELSSFIYWKRVWRRQWPYFIFWKGYIKGLAGFSRIYLYHREIKPVKNQGIKRGSSNPPK